MHDVGEPVELAGQLAAGRAQREQLALAHHPGLLGGVPLGDGDLERGGDPGQRGLGGGDDRGGHLGAAGAGPAPLLQPGPGGALGRGRPQQLIGPAGQRPDPLLAGTDGEPGLHLGLPDLAAAGLQRVPLRGGRLLVDRDLLGRGQPLLQVGQLGHVLLAGLGRGGAGPVQPLGLGRGRAGAGPEPAELLGDGVQLGVGLVEPVERGVDLAAGRVRGGLASTSSAATAGTPGLGLGQPVSASSTAACTSITLGALAEPPTAQSAPSRSPSRGHRAHAGAGRDQVAGGVQVGHHGDPVQRPVQRRPQRRRRLDQVNRPVRPAGSPASRSDPSASAPDRTCPRRPRRRGRLGPAPAHPAPGSTGPAADEQAGAAGVVGLEQPQRRRPRRPARRPRPRRRSRPARRRAPPRAPAARSAARRPCRAGPAAGPGGEQRAGAVLAGQPERERLLAGRPGGPVPLGLPLGLAERPHPRLGRVVAGDRGLVPLVQPELALVERADLGLQRRELRLRGRGPLPRLGRRGGDAGRSPRPSRRAGCGPRRPARRAGPAPRAGRPPRAPPRPAPARPRPAPLQLLPLGDRLGQPAAVVLERVPQRVLLVPDLGRLGLQRRRVPAGAGVVGLGRGQVPLPLGREPVRCRGTARPARTAGTRSPGPGPAPARRRRSPPPARPPGPGPRPAPARPRRAAPGPRSRRRPPGPARVRSATRSSASSRSRASRRSAWTAAARRATSACRPSGLSWRRSSPVRSVSRVEVGLHRVELAQRLLLALAVLEDAGGLLDEPAPVLRAAGSTAVELALADDDVHLPADAGVGQQLLDVEQPAGRRR